MDSINLFGAFLFFYFTFASGESTSISPEVTEANVHKLAMANNEMAFNLFRELASNSSSNLIFSPLSISTAFGILFYGTRGSTAEELRNVLGYDAADLPTDLAHKTFKHFLNEVVNKTDPSTGHVFRAANAIIVSTQFDVLDKYRSDVAELYKAAVRDVDFATEASKVIEEINSWVKKKTNDKIEGFLEDLSPSTLMILLNAVYFKGMWKTQFDPEETTEEIFYNNGLESEGKKVQLMHMTERLLYDSTDDLEALELPYKGNVSMFLLLPNEQDGLKTLEDALTPDKLADMMKKLEEAKVDVSLPKFKLEFEKELSKEMQAVGANRVFSPDADFSGMNSNSGIFVNGIHHKAIIEVNEAGSEASAATGIIIDRMKSPHFKADHPFFFAIIDKCSNMILFMGHVNNL